MNAVYATPYTPAYAAPPQYGLVPVQQVAYPLATVGQTPAPTPGVTPPAKPGITSGAWWQETTGGVPRWALGAGGLALLTIGLAWNAGYFGGKAGAKSGARRSASRDWSFTSNGKRGTTTLSRAKRDHKKPASRGGFGGASRFGGFGRY